MLLMPGVGQIEGTEDAGIRRGEMGEGHGGDYRGEKAGRGALSNANSD